METTTSANNTRQNSGTLHDTYREGEYIVIEIKRSSRVVSFKMREDRLAKLDRLVHRFNLGSRSNVIKCLVDAFIEALDKSEGRLKYIELTIVYEDQVDGDEKKVNVVIKI